LGIEGFAERSAENDCFGGDVGLSRRGVGCEVSRSRLGAGCGRLGSAFNFGGVVNLGLIGALDRLASLCVLGAGSGAFFPNIRPHKLGFGCSLVTVELAGACRGAGRSRVEGAGIDREVDGAGRGAAGAGREGGGLLRGVDRETSGDRGGEESLGEGLE